MTGHVGSRDSYPRHYAHTEGSLMTRQLNARTHDFECVPADFGAIDLTARRVRLAPMHGLGERSAFISAPVRIRRGAVSLNQPRHTPSGLAALEMP